MGSFNSRARKRSEFVWAIAFEYTTRSAPSTFSAWWDVETLAPSAESAVTTDESLASEPLTEIP